MTSQTPKKNILVTGATGNQGSAVIDALLKSPSASTFHIIAVTRSPNSPKAKSIAAKSDSITLLKGDLDSCSEIFTAAPSPINTEEIQGCALIDAALSHNVKHFVQASGDRGGFEKSNIDPTNVPHFATKFHIEQYLQKQAHERMTWTILRPTTFMENVAPDMHGKGFATMWANVGDHKPLQLISARDIGVFAAKAIEAPNDPRFKNTASSLAGDALTQKQANVVFERVFGREMPKTFCAVAQLVQWRIPEVKSMFEWFGREGYGADVEACREIWPGLQNFEAWLREGSGFTK